MPHVTPLPPLTMAPCQARTEDSLSAHAGRTSRNACSARAAASDESTSARHRLGSAWPDPRGPRSAATHKEDMPREQTRWRNFHGAYRLSFLSSSASTTHASASSAARAGGPGALGPAAAAASRRPPCPHNVAQSAQSPSLRVCVHQSVKGLKTEMWQACRRGGWACWRQHQKLEGYR